MVDIHAMSIRLPETVYEALRREAYMRHLPMNFIVAEALQEHLTAFFSAHPKA